MIPNDFEVNSSKVKVKRTFNNVTAGWHCYFRNSHLVISHPVNSFPNDKFIDWSKFKAFADVKIYVTQTKKFFFGMGRKLCGKRRKCWSPAFSPFPTMFSKGLFFRVVKSLDCVVMGYRTFG